MSVYINMTALTTRHWVGLSPSPNYCMKRKQKAYRLKSKQTAVIRDNMTDDRKALGIYWNK